MQATSPALEFKSDIEEIMRAFDFRLVHKVMTYINWQWQGDGVPSLARLQARAMDLLANVTDPSRNCVMSSTGGLRAERQGKNLRLSFELSYSETYYDEEISDEG